MSGYTLHVKRAGADVHDPTLCDIRGAYTFHVKWPGAKEYAKCKARIEENGDKMCETCDEKAEGLTHEEVT